jgi:hypothetical protein
LNFFFINLIKNQISKQTDLVGNIRKMEEAKMEVNLKDMTFYEFEYDIKNLPLILKLISEFSLELLEKKRKDAYDRVNAYLEQKWNTEYKLLISPEQGYNLFSRKYRKRLMSDLKKTHNMLRKEGLIIINNEMQKYFSNKTIELNDIIINKWKNRYEETLRRKVGLDEYNSEYLDRLIEDLKFQSKRILWIYQDKAFSQFDIFRKTIKFEIENC